MSDVTRPPDADALARLRMSKVAGCLWRTEDEVHDYALYYAHWCDACAALLVAAIAAPERERVERDTIERCATTCEAHAVTVRAHRVAHVVRALPPRYGENPKEGT